jgi:hypothetical protein
MSVGQVRVKWEEQFNRRPDKLSPHPDPLPVWRGEGNRFTRWDVGSTYFQSRLFSLSSPNEERAGVKSRNKFLLRIGWGEGG